MLGCSFPGKGLCTCQAFPSTPRECHSWFLSSLYSNLFLVCAPALEQPRFRSPTWNQLQIKQLPRLVLRHRRNPLERGLDSFCRGLSPIAPDPPCPDPQG